MLDGVEDWGHCVHASLNAARTRRVRAPQRTGDMLRAMCKRVVIGMMLAWIAAFGQTRPQPPRSVRLYVFDDGMIHGINPEMFHFKKEEVAVADMVVASYLIVHPKGTLMWDSGAIPDGDIKDDGTVATAGLYQASKTLKGQLAAIGYAPKDITYFALSHYHGDHTANANAFAGATWLVQKPERDAMFGEKAPPITQRSRYNALENSNTKILAGQDFDV